MGLYANFPIALAPGMGLNAYFTYSVVKGHGHPLAGCPRRRLRLRRAVPHHQRDAAARWIIDSISKSQKLAISVGIGFFLAVLGLQAGGFIAGDPTTLVKLGDMKSPGVAIAAAAFVLMAALEARRIPGAILIGILFAYLAALLLGLAPVSAIASAPPSIAPVFLQLDFSALLNAAMIPGRAHVPLRGAVRQYRHPLGCRPAPPA